jgi:hypothetical protein
MIPSCASKKKESITIAFPYDRLPGGLLSTSLLGTGVFAVPALAALVAGDNSLWAWPLLCFKPLMIPSCASKKKESITIAFPYDRLPGDAAFCGYG